MQDIYCMNIKVKMSDDTFEILQNVDILLSRGNYRDAIEILTQTTQFALKNKRPDELAAIYKRFGNILISYSNILISHGNLEKNKEFFEHLLKIFEFLASLDPFYITLVASTEDILGALLTNMGRLEEAKLRFEQALKMREALLNTNPENTKCQLDVAVTQNNIGLLLQDMGKIEEAKFRFELALKIHQALLNKDPENALYKSNVAITQNYFGTLLKNIGLFEEANYWLRRALEMHDSLLYKDPENELYKSNVAMILDNLGALLQNIGMFEEAKLRFMYALEIYESLLNKDTENILYKSNVATALNNMGNLLSEESNFLEAIGYYSKALDIVIGLGKLDLVFKILADRGKCYEKMGNFNQAYEDYRESIELIDLIRSQFSLEEYKLDILRDKENLFSDMISLLCTKKNDVGKAWEYVGLVKSRTLLEYLRFIELPIPQNIPKNLQSKEKELIEAIRICDRRARGTKIADLVYSLSQEITKLRSELDKLYGQIMNFAPEYVDLRRGLPLSIDGIIDLLKNRAKRQPSLSTIQRLSKCLFS